MSAASDGLDRQGRATRADAHDAGATLVELLVVMLLVGVVGGIALSGTVMGMDSSRHAQERVDALTDTQTMVERVSREVRASARLNDLDASLADLDVIRDDMRIRFVYEAVGDELIQQREEFHSAAALEPGFDSQAETPDQESEQVLLDGLVDTNVFAVYGGDGRDLDLDGDGQLRDVRRVELVVVRRIGSAEADREPLEVRATVWPRNAENLDGA